MKPIHGARGATSPQVIDLRQRLFLITPPAAPDPRPSLFRPLGTRSAPDYLSPEQQALLLALQSA